ncbi:cell division cycle-associated protein 2 [Electrophorus electricus]|uniref:cell division cycle-associated protein 2 n=1 Tax=Electrophorus electricus TaxID=8005 RepID=UPI0015D05842|nr:cell division cycle-associated protein 2 [Electrophorus electricus]XP_026881778.2 cell division cycle-associated protein 2 [Electrophorus electricus]
MASRTPLGTLTASRQNSEGGDGVDFSKLTPSQFGISTDSFLTFPKDKNKSRVSQLKARRRSTVGLRGSPETSSLISFRAKQAMKTPPRSPQHMLSSPLFSGCDSIKQKMAAFQRLMGADEENSGQSTPLTGAEGSREWEVGGSLPKDLPLDSEGCLGQRESQLISRICPPPDTPTATPPLSKRRRRVPRGLCEEEIQEEPLCDLPGTPNQEPGVGFSQLQSLKPTQDLHSDSQSKLLSFPMLTQPETTITDQIPALSHVTEVSSASRKKRVRFGAPLSPEFFDKTLPPSTPLQRGATPLCPPSSTGHKRSLLKTPQQCEPPLPQPNFSSPESHDGSLVLTGPGCGSEGLCCEDVFVGPQKISFLMEDEFENPPVDRKDSTQAGGGDVIPLAADTSLLNAAFQEDEGPQSHAPLTHPPVTAAEPETNPEQHQQQQQQEAELKSPAPTTKAPRSRSRKRKSPAGCDAPESRRSSRSAASAAKGKMKTAAANRRFGSKEVDRSLYGKRDYASRNPMLSPIFEAATAILNGTPPRLTQAANPDCRQTTSPSIQYGKTRPSEETANLRTADTLWHSRFSQANEVTNGITCTPVWDTPASESEVGVAPSGVSHTGNVGSVAPRAKRNRGRPLTRRRSWNVSKSEMEKVSGGMMGKRQHVEESPLESTTGGQMSDPAKSQGVPAKPKVCLQEDGSHAFTVGNAGDFTGTLDQDKGGELERKTPNGSRQARVQRGRKNLRVKSTEEEEEEDHQSILGAKTEEKNKESLDKPSVAVGPSKISEISGEGWRDGGENAEPVLESWQQVDFSIEDILKPTVKGRGSVRRSLRNRLSVDAQASGLAWVERTPPEQSTASRRKTRGRLSAVLEAPPLPLAPREEELNQAD